MFLNYLEIICYVLIKIRDSLCSFPLQPDAVGNDCRSHSALPEAFPCPLDAIPGPKEGGGV